MRFLNCAGAACRHAAQVYYAGKAAAFGQAPEKPCRAFLIYCIIIARARGLGQPGQMINGLDIAGQGRRIDQAALDDVYLLTSFQPPGMSWIADESQDFG